MDSDATPSKESDSKESRPVEKPPASQAIVRVFIIDKHHSSRARLKSVLCADANISLIGEAETESAAMSSLDEVPADVIVLNDAQDSLSAETCRRLKFQNPKVSIILLTSDPDCRSFLEAFKAGVSAYCLKDIDADRLRTAIVAARFSDLWIDSGVMAQLINELRGGEAAQPDVDKLSDNQTEFTDNDTIGAPVSLTEREHQVLKLIVSGMKNQAIARALQISTATVKAHVRNLLSKLGAAHRTQAAVEALRRGLV